MTPEGFDEFRHEAVHGLMDLNEKCNQTFKIGTWPRWDYDLDSGTLTFSENGVPRVIAQIQVVGTTSTAAKTWMWAWANESMPSCVTSKLSEVRDFGRREGLQKLIEPEIADDEFLGWAMTAIAARLIHAKGAYRCPSDRGFLYLIYTDIGFADQGAVVRAPHVDVGMIECNDHGQGQKTYVCEHLSVNPRQEWFSDLATPEKPWPDAWCAECDRFYQEHGEWNEANEGRIKIKLLCHRCYERFRAQDPTV